MPNNWKTYKLGEIAKLRKKNITPKDFDNQHYIGLEHIGQGTFLLDGIGTASDATSNKSLFKSGDILYGKIRPYFKKVYRPKFSGICSTDILVINSKNEELITQNYLHQIIKTQDFTDKATETSSGTKMPRADWNSLEKLEYNLPPLQEQKSIASILSTIDDKIENNLAINKTLEEMAMALYKHWFIDFGPFQNGEFVDSELGSIPKGWEVKSVYEIASYVNGAAFKSKDFVDNKKQGLPVIKIAEIKQGITPQTMYSDKELDLKFIINNNDILFPWSGNPQTSLGIHLWDKGKALLNQHIFVVRVGDLSHKCYVFNSLKNLLPTFIKLASHKQTTGLGHVTTTNLKELKIPNPKDEIINSYNLEALSIFDLIYSNQMENIQLTQLRDTLLPKLISGEVRLKEFRE
jgi:type I restriction enzyme S subunit